MFCTHIKKLKLDVTGPHIHDTLIRAYIYEQCSEDCILYFWIRARVCIVFEISVQVGCESEISKGCGDLKEIGVARLRPFSILKKPQSFSFRAKIITE